MIDRLVVSFLLLLLRCVSMEQIETTIVHIREELPSNSLILSSTKQLRWFSSSLKYQSYFRLKENSSLFTSDRRLDREELCRTSICSICLNFFQISNETDVSIRRIEIFLTDINDHSPRFLSSILRFSLPENVPIGYEILLDAAIDDDDGNNSIQSYRLIPIFNNPFELILRQKPILKVKTSIDRERISNYSLKLIAFDGGEPIRFGEQIIEINVKDVNDHPPILNQTIYRRTIREDESLGKLLLRIVAFDRDEDENGELIYTIDDPTSTFVIDRRTGNVSLKKRLDFEQRRSFVLPVIVSDLGHPPLKSYATIFINVTDANDHSPRLVFPSLNNNESIVIVHLSECRLALILYTFDEDFGENARHHCQLNDTRLLIKELTPNVFNIEFNFSSIEVDDNEQFIDVQIKCHDFGDPKLENSRSISIDVDVCRIDRPEIISILHRSLRIPSERIEFPLLINQIKAKSFRFLTFQSEFSSLNLTFDSDGNVFLQSHPMIFGIFTVKIIVSDEKNHSSTCSIELEFVSSEIDWRKYLFIGVVLFLIGMSGILFRRK